MDLKGKKLLILGGNAISCEIVNAAKSLGVYTVVTDWNSLEKSPAKKIADDFWSISLLDYTALLEKIKEEKIDGILTGYTDSYLLPYQHICELSGLPCYATKEVFERTMDKATFKQYCRDNGISVIPEYQMETFDPSIICTTNKIIIKPVDNSGSRGVVLCEKQEDYSKCLEYALSFSEKKRVLIEKFMEMDGISVSYTFQDGEASLSTTDDRNVHRAPNGSSIARLSIYPSKYTDTYVETMDQKVKDMLLKIGIRNGVAAITFFTDGTSFYAMEMGHRLTGGQHYTYTKTENDTSALDCLIHFALTGRMADYRIAERDNARFKNIYCHLFILGKQGIISRFDGLDYLQNLPELIHFSLGKRVGDLIGSDGTTSQKVVGLHLKLESLNDLDRIKREIQQNVHFYDEAGNDLTLEIE